MIIKMADLESEEEFDYSSPEAVDRMIQCTTQALPYFSATSKSTKFLEFIVMKALPHYYELPDLTGVEVRDQLAKLLAELAVNTAGLADPATAAANVFDRLIDYMPLPPATEDGEMTEVPNLEFTKVECLMFAFHSIGRQDENFLKSDDERLKDFRSRLQYLARGVQGYIKKLKEFLAKPTPGTGSDDIKIKQIALRTNENIQAMIRDLFHSPPIYKAKITLSFKPKASNNQAPAKAGEKRKQITFNKSGSGSEAGGKKRQLYMDVVGKGRGVSRSGVSNYKPAGKVNRPSGQYNVPQGKYSSKINNKGG